MLGVVANTCRSTYYHIKDCYLCNFNRNIVHLLVIINKFIQNARYNNQNFFIV